MGAAVTRMVACRRCGSPNALSLCSRCRGETYGSSEYQRNSALISTAAKRAVASGLKVACVICGKLIIRCSDVTVEHIRSVSQGGGNGLDNLGPAHTACNYAKRAAR